MLDIANSRITGTAIRGHMAAELDDSDKKLIKSLAEMLEQFTLRRPNIPTLQIIMMLRLALDEGKSQKHYSEKWDIPPSTVSRAMLDMGKRTRQGQEGLGLIDERVSTHSLREHEVYLSTKGKALLLNNIKKLCK